MYINDGVIELQSSTELTDTFTLFRYSESNAAVRFDSTQNLTTAFPDYNGNAKVFVNPASIVFTACYDTVSWLVIDMFCLTECLCLF